MARIEFPQALVDGEMYKHNGVLYQYQGNPPNGFWAANSQNILRDNFVDTSGDAMSGDLTMLSFAGSGNAAIGVDGSGKLFRVDVNSIISSPFVNKSGDTLSGNLDFTNSLGNVTLSLTRMGAGLFNSDIRSGDFDINSMSIQSDIATLYGGGIVSGSLYAKRSDSNSLPVFSGFSISGTKTSDIYGDGGAEFAEGNISLTGTGTIACMSFVADGPYQTAAGIRQTIKDDNLTINKLVLGDGTTAIGGALAGYPNSGSPNILLSADGNILAENIDCKEVAFGSSGEDEVVISGTGTLSVKAGGNASFKDVNLASVSGQTASLSTSLVAGGVTLTAGGVSISGSGSTTDVVVFDSAGNGTFTGDVTIGGSVTAAALSVTGAISADSFGDVVGTTGAFSGQLSASSAAIQGSVTASSVSVSDCSASTLTLTGDITSEGGGLFADGKVNFAAGGSIITHSANTGIEVGTIGSDADSIMLNGLAGSTGVGTGSQRFRFNGDGSVSLASGNLMIGGVGDLQNINNAYGAISDRKFKEDITPAQSQWEDIKRIQLVNYSFKSELGWGSGRRLGVVSQELRRVCPGLVDVKKDYKEVSTPVFSADGMPKLDEEGNQLHETTKQATGTTTESVKYSVLYLKAVGGLQEAMRRIESLESEIKSLKE